MSAAEPPVYEPGLYTDDASGAAVIVRKDTGKLHMLDLAHDAGVDPSLLAGEGVTLTRMVPLPSREVAGRYLREKAHAFEDAECVPWNEADDALRELWMLEGDTLRAFLAGLQGQPG